MPFVNATRFLNTLKSMAEWPVTYIMQKGCDNCDLSAIFIVLLSISLHFALYDLHQCTRIMKYTN